MLIWFISKETYKFSEILKYLVCIRIVPLDYYGNKIGHTLCNNFRNFYTVPVTVFIFIKPTQKQSVTHSLTIITCFTLI